MTSFDDIINSKNAEIRVLKSENLAYVKMLAKCQDSLVSLQKENKELTETLKFLNQLMDIYDTKLSELLKENVVILLIEKP